MAKKPQRTTSIARLDNVNKFQVLVLVLLLVTLGVGLKFYSSASGSVSGRSYMASKYGCSGHPFIKSGSGNKACVRAIQAVLQVAVGLQAGHTSEFKWDGIPAVDGSFGPETYKYVVKFQHKVFPNDSGQWDGQVGSNTWGKLDNVRIPN